MVDGFGPIAGSEDFAYYLQEKPGCFLRLGNGEGAPMLHNASYDFNDDNLTVGAAYWTRLVERFLATAAVRNHHVSQTHRDNPLASPVATPASQTRIVVAAVIGNLLEFFDFTVYSFFALTIAKLFFPAHDPVVSTLLALSAFAIGFVARPVGGFVLGHYADKHGRRAALTLTIFLMAVGSAMIGLAPGYATIGLAAPAWIVFARLLQGFAQGGEFGAATATLLETGFGQGPRLPGQLATGKPGCRRAARLRHGRAAQLPAHQHATARLGMARAVSGRRR